MQHDGTYTYMKDIKTEEKHIDEIKKVFGNASYSVEKPYGHSLLESVCERPNLCICGEPLDNSGEHYIHMSQGY